MSQTITTRLPENFVSGLHEIAKLEQLDKSAVIRRLLAKAIKQWKTDYALEQYKRGNFSIGQAANFSESNLWDFFDLLKEKKVLANYDLEELKSDLEIVKWKKKRQ